MNVTGIEVLPTAIGLCRKEFDVLKDVAIHEGSVTDMPFDDEVFDGIFCYGLIYLLDEASRKIFLDSCFRQLAPGGLMIFSVISKQASFFGQGKCLGTDCYERSPGVSIFFYDALSAEQELSSYGYVSQSCMDEPHSDGSTMPFINVVYKKSWPVLCETASEITRHIYLPRGSVMRQMDLIFALLYYTRRYNGKRTTP